jgi:hypothetical protein
MDVTGGHTVQQRVLGQRERRIAAERSRQPAPEHPVEVIAGGHLEQAAGHPEARVAKAVDLLGGMDLAEAGEGGHVALQGVVVPAGVDQVVALDAARVGDQVPQGDLDGGAGVGHRELLQLRAHRLVERHEPRRLGL